MKEINQENNPYAPPSASDEVTSASLANPEIDPIEDMLRRAYYGCTYGTAFLPGIVYWISVSLLLEAYFKREEFSPKHESLFRKTSIICMIQFIPMVALVTYAVGAIAFSVLF